jgi:tyrosine-protein kinase Etk/Wzc
LYTQVYSKGTLRDVLIYPNPVKFITLNPNALQNSPNLPISFEYLPTKNYITISGKKYVLGSPVRTPYGDFIINPVKALSSVSEQGYKGEFYLQIRTVKDAAKSIQGALTVGQGARQSSLISLKLADQVPIRAEDILNDLVTVYNKAGIDEKVLSATNTLNFINSRLALVQRELSGVETEMQDYRTTQGIVDLSTEGRTYLANAQKNDDQLAQLQIQLDVLNQVEKYIVGKRNQSGTVPSTLGINDPILTQLLDRLYTAELELSNLKQTAGENSPPVAAVQERINQIKPSLLENLNALRQNLLATQRRIRSESGLNTSQLKTVPSKERKFLEISRQQAIKNNIYTLLLTKREEVELSRAAAVADSRIVNFAESRGAPIKPVPLNILC